MAQEHLDIAEPSLIVTKKDFDQQSAVWLKTWNLYLILWDSLQIIHKNQNEAKGFLYAGKIYTLQGDNKRAARILEKGMAAVQPTDPQLKLFKPLYSGAKARAEGHIDFITVSPHEILCQIVKWLDNPTLIQCIGVSPAWMSILFKCPAAWRNISSKNCKFWREDAGFDLLATSVISQYIESIDIRDSPKHMRKLIDILSCGRFPRLSSLSFLPTREGQIDISRELFLTLEHTADTLTELRFQWQFNISLGNVLSTCRNLTFLDLCARSIKDCDISHDTLLTRVNIELFLAPSITETLAPLFKHSPKLQSFCFHPHRYTADNLLASIGDHCPRLTRISTNMHALDKLYDHLPELAAPMKNDGLELLVLSSVRTIQPIASLIANGYKTLRAIYLNPIHDSGNPTWKPLYESTMPQLTYLQVDFMEETTLPNHLGAILRMCPALETLILNDDTEEYIGYTEGQIDDMFDAVSTLPNLSHLELRMFDNRGQGFIRYFQSCQHNSALKVLIMSVSTEISGDTLKDIARIKSLQRLTIIYEAYIDIDIPDEDIVQFFELIQLLPHLNYLELNAIQIPDRAAEALALSTSLKTVILYCIKEDLSDDAQSVLYARFGRGLSFDWP